MLSQKSVISSLRVVTGSAYHEVPDTMMHNLCPNEVVLYTVSQQHHSWEQTLFWKIIGLQDTHLTTH